MMRLGKVYPKSLNAIATWGVGALHTITTLLNSYQTKIPPIYSILKLSQIQRQVLSPHGEYDMN